jgi:tricorn protease
MATGCILVLASALVGPVVAATAGEGGADPGAYLAHPALHGDRLVFQARGDLWTTRVPAPGERAVAQRLTSAVGTETWPCISPDGTMVAYAGSFDGNPEVFVLPLAGGTPRRLTYHGGRDEPVAWTPDGSRLLIRSDRASPHGDLELFLVPAAGGPLERVPFGEGSLASFNRATGELAFLPRSNEGWYWKGYRGGTAPDIWRTDRDFKDFTRVTRTECNELFPMWIGDRLWFLADDDGRMNIWSCRPDGSDRTRHTSAGPADFDLRWASADAAGAPRIVYAQGGTLHVFDATTGAERPLDIALQGDRLDWRERMEPVGPTLAQVALSPDAKRLAIVSRGEILVGPVGKPEKGVPQAWIQVPGLSESRESGVSWTPDGTLLLVTDRGGEATIATLDVGRLQEGQGGVEPIRKEDRWIFAPVEAPGGAHIAFGDKSMRMLVLATADGEVRVAGTSPAGEVTDYRFSPDGRWLAWVATLPTGFGEIHLYDTRSGEDTTLGSGMTDDRMPRWDPKGLYLYFASARAINPELDQFDLAFATREAWQFYAAPLRASTPPPLARDAAAAGMDLAEWAAPAVPSGDDAEDADDAPVQPAKGNAPAKAGAAAKPAAAGAHAKPGGAGRGSAPSHGRGDEDAGKAADVHPAARLTPVEIERDGLLARAALLPVEAGTFRDVEAVYGGLIYLRVPRQGVADEEWPPPVLGPSGARLERVDLSTGEASPVVEYGVNAAAVSTDRSAVVVATTTPEGAAHAGAPGGGAGGAGKGGPAISVIPLQPGGEAQAVPVTGLVMRVDIAAEWRQIFDEAWRLQRDFFWKPDLGGVDWRAVRARYEALLPRIGTREELNDLVGEMSGELGTSHTYIGGGDALAKPTPTSIGVLGVDVTPTPRGLRIDAILPNAPDLEGPVSPLAAAHLGVRPGDTIVSVDGRPAAGVSEIGELLQGRAGRTVALGVAGADGRVRVLEVEALEDDRPLRYAAWVEGNRRTVAEKSQGRLGYMHLPDMDSAGLAAFVRGFYPQTRKDGLIVDERWNGGGYVSQMVLERLRRRPIAAGIGREGAPETYPVRAMSGPMAVLINERAGSDGDIFPTGFRLYGLGPLIGTRTWGGVVGIRGDKPFVDAGMATQPEYAWWDAVLGFGLEGHGIAPDIEVERSPADIAAGRDPQLERAIAELLPRLGTEAAPRPPVPGKGNTPMPPAAR